MFSIIRYPEYIADIIKIREIVIQYTDFDCTLEQAERLRLIVSREQWVKRFKVPKNNKTIYCLLSKYIIQDEKYFEDLVINKKINEEFKIDTDNDIDISMDCNI